VSFPPIVASGPNASLPHAVPRNGPSKRESRSFWTSGQNCVLLFRHEQTWIAGEARHATPGTLFRCPRSQLRPRCHQAGKETTESDAVARDFIAKAGYGNASVTDWATAVGLAVHEKPG